MTACNIIILNILMSDETVTAEIAPQDDDLNNLRIHGTFEE